MIKRRPLSKLVGQTGLSLRHNAVLGIVIIRNAKGRRIASFNDTDVFDTDGNRFDVGA